MSHPIISVSQRPEISIDYSFAPACISKASVLDWLAESFEFPSYFGNNWDAAWDCLSEVAWNPQQPITVYLTSAQATEVDPDSFAQLLELLSDAAEQWQGLVIYLQQ